MSQPALYDLSYYRGRTDLASVQWFDVNEAPVDLTGYTVGAFIRDEAGSLLASTASEITATVTTATGLIVLTITDAAGQAMSAGVHRWDVWAVSSGGVDYPLVTGAFTVLPEVRYA